MEQKPWTTLSTKTINKNPWSEFRHDEFILPDGENGNYYYIHTPGSVCVIAVTHEGQLVMLRGHRYLFQRESMAFVAGGMKPDQSPREAAKVELKEETGYTAGSIIKIGSFAPSTGLLQEYTHVFLATDLEEGEQELEPGENWELEHCTVNKFEEMLGTEEIWDGFTYAAWALGRSHVMDYIKSL